MKTTNQKTICYVSIAHEWDSLNLDVRRLSLVFADRPLIFGLLWITVRVWTISHTTQLWRVLCNRHLDDSRNDPRLETLPHHDDHLLPEKSRHTGPVYDVCCALMLAAGIRYHSTAQWKTASLVSVTFNNVKYPPPLEISSPEISPTENLKTDTNPVMYTVLSSLAACGRLGVAAAGVLFWHAAS